MSLVRFKVFLLAFVFSSAGYAAEKIETYSAVAKNDAGAVQYIENHEVTLSESGQVKEAKTKYSRANGQLIGTLASNFSASVSSPDYTFKDERDGSSHGLINESDRITIWRQNKGKSREEKHFKKSEFPKESLVVGCQGLHYHLVRNFDEAKQKKKVSLKYLIPGKLDTYSFTLQFLKEDDLHYHLTVKVDSLFLRMFVSELKIKYRKSDNRLVSYSGLSNIPDDSGDIQNVNIEYAYQERP